MSILMFASSVYAECNNRQSYYNGPCNADCRGISVEGKCFDCGGKWTQAADDAGLGNVGDNDGICPNDFRGTNDPLICADDTDDDCGITPAGCTDCSELGQTDCNTGQCGTTRCYWDTTLGDECESCTSGMTCSDYNNNDACTNDNCNTGNCGWVNGECKEISQETCKRCTSTGTCETVIGTCSDDQKCISNSDCTTDSHNACVGYSCTAISGGGTNTCTSASCGSPTPPDPSHSHLACTADKKCQWVEGVGENDCNTETSGTSTECSSYKKICLLGSLNCITLQARGYAACNDNSNCQRIITTTAGEPFPVFTWFNLMITGFLLIGFYAFGSLRKR